MRQTKLEDFLHLEEHTKELEKKIEEELEKNKDKDKLIFQQNKMLFSSHFFRKSRNKGKYFVLGELFK